MRGRCPYLPLDSKSEFLQFNLMVTRKRFPISGRGMAFITTTVRNWLPLFSDRNCALTVLDQLRETVNYHNLSLVAYVLMPSHIHLLLGFQSIEIMSKVMQNFKLLSAHRLKPLVPSEFGNELYIGDNFRMWQPRFDDVIIYSEKQFKIKIEYIHNNPVKAGLVKSATDYIYSSAGDWLLDKEGPLPVDKDWSWLKEN